MELARTQAGPAGSRRGTFLLRRRGPHSIAAPARRQRDDEGDSAGVGFPGLVPAAAAAEVAAAAGARRRRSRHAGRGGPRCAWRGRRAGGPRPGGRPRRKCARGPAAGGGGEQARQAAAAAAAAAPLAPRPHTRGHQRKRRPLTARPSFRHGTDDSSKRDCHGHRRRRLPSRGSSELTPPGRRRRRHRHPARTTRPRCRPLPRAEPPSPLFSRRSSSVGPGLLRPRWVVRRLRPGR